MIDGGDVGGGDNGGSELALWQRRWY